MAVVTRAVVALLAALVLAPVAAGGEGEGTWSPDGMVCRIGATPTCRYVAPGCVLVQVMDPGTRWVLWCREPKGAE